MYKQKKVDRLDEMLEYHFQLKTHGLYVEPLSGPLDLTTSPRDGHEYIHRQRLEEVDLERLCYQRSQLENTERPKPSKGKLSEWKKDEARKVHELSVKLNANRKFLKEKFPKSSWIPLGSEKAACKFCLGSELYAKIYGNEDSDAKEGHQPQLSIVLYLSQRHIELLYQYLYKWYLLIGMENSLSEWLYALSVCLQRPLRSEFYIFFEKFYDDCLAKSKTCVDPLEKKRFHLFLGIFRIQFSATLIGAPLLKYHKLTMQQYH